mgnify:CR=1 FL=1
MKPIKVKAFGLINFTKKQYIITQVIVFALIAVLFVLSLIYDFDKFVFGNAKAVILLITFLETMETFFMIKKFRSKELLK